MKHRSRRQPISNINVVPYLDVLLVLLVIFMVTAPLFNQGVIGVPEVGEKPLPAADRVGLEIEYKKSSSQQYRLIDHKYGADIDGLNEKALIAELKKQAILYGDEKPSVILSAEGELLYEEVIKLLGVLRDEGYDKINLSARAGSR